MAKELLFRINIENAKGIVEVNREIDRLTKIRKGYLEQQKTLIAQGKQESVQFKTLDEALSRNVAKTDQLRQQKQQLNLTSRNIAKSTNAESNSINALAARYNLLVQRIRNTNRSTKEGQKEFDRLTKEANELSTELKQLESSYGSNTRNVGNYKSALGGLQTGFLKVTAVAGAAILAFNRIASAANEFIQAADAQIKAEKQLEFALGGVSQALLDQASALQQVTLFGDETIIQQQAFLASLGFTEDQIQELIPAALDLATATGQTLEFAVKNLAKTYGGLTGELGEVIPQLKDLTEEELKAGAAVEFASKQFAGQAEAAVTGAGAITQFENTVGDLQENLGFLLIKALDPLVSITNSLTRELVSLTSATDSQSEAVSNEQAEFNALIKTLERNIDNQEIRSKLITEINTKYGNYLPNLLSEKSTIEDIAIAQEEANKQFNQRIILIAAQEELVRINRELLENEKERLNLEKQLTIEQSKTVENLDKAANSLSGIDVNAAGARNRVRDIQDAIEDNKNETEQLKEEFDLATNAAINLGLNIDQVLSGSANTIKDTTNEVKKLAKAIDTTGLKKGVDQLEGGSDKNLPEIVLGDEEELAQAKKRFFATIDEAVEKSDLELEELAAKRRGIAVGFLEDISNFVGVAEEASQVRLQNELNRIDKAREAEIAAAQASIQDEEVKAAKIANINSKYDQRKAQEERKAAKRSKRIQIIQATVQTAQAVLNAFSSGMAVPVIGPALAATYAAIAAAFGAAQIGIIASQKFAKGGKIPFKEGGMIQGNSHANGGVKFAAGGQIMEAEGGEVILNKSQQAKIGARTFAMAGVPGFADGGIVPKSKYQSGGVVPSVSSSGMVEQQQMTAASIAERVGAIPVINNVTNTSSQQASVTNQLTDSQFSG